MEHPDENSPSGLVRSEILQVQAVGHVEDDDDTSSTYKCWAECCLDSSSFITYHILIL